MAKSKEEKKKVKKARVLMTPLLLRDGAAYTCFSDGLCCTDIHGLGPMTKSELVQIKKINKKGASYNEEFEDYMLNTAADGGCVFLRADLLCSVHAEKGPEFKPEGCRRFPLGITATPKGGRITTEHRCPCRTVGERPLLTAEDALPSLLDEDGDPTEDRKIRSVRLAKKKTIDFEAWEAIEQKLFEKINAGDSLDEVLESAAFPKLKGSSWEDQAEEFIGAKDGSQFGFAIAWFGDCILQLVHETRPRVPFRPWKKLFDDACEKRIKTVRDSETVFADWIMDEIWSLKWAEETAFDVARAEMYTRLVIARLIAKHITEVDGSNSERAAAEAVFVVSLIGDSDFWNEVVERARV